MLRHFRYSDEIFLADETSQNTNSRCSSAGQLEKVEETSMTPYTREAVDYQLCYADTPRGWRIRILYVSDTDMPRIRLGYVSRRILKMQIRFVLDTCIRHVWATWDTAQTISQPNSPPQV